MRIGRGAKVLNLFLAFLLVVNVFLGLGNVVHAEEGEEKPVLSGEGVNILSKSKKEVYDKVKDTLKYDEDLHFEMTKEILKGKGYNKPGYKNLYKNTVEVNGKELGNGDLAFEGVLSDSLEDYDVSNRKAILRMPAYDKVNDKGDHLTLKDLNKPSWWFTNFNWSSNSLSNLYVGKNVYDMKIIRDGGFGALPLTLASDFNDKSYMNKFLSNLFENNAKTLTGSVDAADDKLSVDSYGNIVSHNLDVIVPYWWNIGMEELWEGSLNKGNSMFITHFGLRDKQAVEKMLGATFQKDSFREYIDFKGKGDSIYSVILDEKGIKSSAGYYVDLINDNNIDIIAKYLVDSTKVDVKKYNEQILKNIEDGFKEDSEDEYYMEGYFGDEAGFGGENSINDELDKFNAMSLLKRIESYLLNPFKFIQLTVAGLVMNLYTEIFLNFNIGEVFNTTLVTDSIIWKKINNTLLILGVTFAGLLLLMMLVKLIMGLSTLKEIIKRMVLLAFVLALPMMGYGPAVDLMFNKPVSKVMNGEVNKMFLFDNQLDIRRDLIKEWSEKYPDFFSDYDLRDRGEEYIIPFFTNQHISGVKVETDEDIEYLGGVRKDDMVVVNISAFHLYEWMRDLREGATSSSLFRYLHDTYYSSYEGIELYDEFKYDFSMEFFEDEYKKPTISASDMLYRLNEGMLDYNEEIGDRMKSVVGMLFEEDKETHEPMFTESEREDFMRELAMTSRQRDYIFKNGGGLSSVLVERMYELGFVEEMKEDFLGLASEKSGRGLAEIYASGIMSEERLDEIIYNVNRKMMNYYLSNFHHLEMYMSRESEYVESLNRLLILNTFFELNKEFKVPLFPQSLDMNNLTMDSYLRTLYVPMVELRPGNVGLENVASYVTIKDGLTGTLLFGIFLFLLFAYSSVKYLVLFWLLLPVFYIMLFYHYVWANNIKSKVWTGIMGILGTFAGVNFGLVLVWSLLVKILNGASGSGSVWGIRHYPVVIFHSLAMILYLVIVFHFVLRPLFKMVWRDKVNLGGSLMEDKMLRVGGRVAVGMKNFWDGLGSATGKVGEGIEGSASGSSGVKAGDEVHAGNAAKMGLSRAWDKGKEVAGNVPNVLNKLRGVGQSDSVLGSMGLQEFSDAYKKDPTDDEALFKSLEGKIRADGSKWIGKGVTINDEKGQAALKEAKGIVSGLEEYKGKRNLSSEEMARVEKGGMDRKVEVLGKANSHFSTPKITERDSRKMGVIKEALDELGYGYNESGSSLELNMSKEEYDNGAGQDIFKRVAEISNSKVRGFKGGKYDTLGKTMENDEIVSDMLKDNWSHLQEGVDYEHVKDEKSGKDYYKALSGEGEVAFAAMEGGYEKASRGYKKTYGKLMSDSLNEVGKAGSVYGKTEKLKAAVLQGARADRDFEGERYRFTNRKFDVNAYQKEMDLLSSKQKGRKVEEDKINAEMLKIKEKEKEVIDLVKNSKLSKEQLVELRSNMGSILDRDGDLDLGKFETFNKSLSNYGEVGIEALAKQQQVMDSFKEGSIDKAERNKALQRGIREFEKNLRESEIYGKDIKAYEDLERISKERAKLEEQKNSLGNKFTMSSEEQRRLSEFEKLRAMGIDFRRTGDSELIVSSAVSGVGSQLEEFMEREMDLAERRIEEKRKEAERKKAEQARRQGGPGGSRGNVPPRTPLK